MPVDQKVIRKAMDDFQDDKFSNAKEKIKDEFKKAKNTKIKTQIGIDDDEFKFKGRKPEAQKKAELDYIKAKENLDKIRKERAERLNISQNDDDIDDENNDDENIDDNEEKNIED